MMSGMGLNNFTYQSIEGVPNQKVLEELLQLYNELFEDARLNFFKERIYTKEDIIIILCYNSDLLIGFKLGYQYDKNTLYSWVGGVLIEYRNQGIGKELLQMQHNLALRKGYKKVRTKSMNRFKPMIILNLKNGFDIIKVYTNDSQQTKIIFEKKLNIN
jgi:predicted GNAT superfamily acetyltransferase